MNTYLFYRRIRGPIFLLTFGVTALLWEWNVLAFWQSWPLYLIVAGVLRLAEGASLVASGSTPLDPAFSYPAQGYPAPGYSGPAPSYPGSGAGGAYPPAQPASGTSSGTTPAATPGTGLATLTPATIQPAYQAGTEEEG